MKVVGPSKPKTPLSDLMSAVEAGEGVTMSAGGAAEVIPRGRRKARRSLQLPKTGLRLTPAEILPARDAGRR